jgi:ParB-like chromosome segregation protein Spo0J
MPKPPPKSATLTVKRLPLTRLKPHPKNPRSHPTPGSAEWVTLKKSLESDYFDPLVWNKHNGLLVSGHLRAKILSESGYASADCVIVDWDEPTHLARMIAANKLQGENDDKLLAEIFRELTAADVDLDLTGFTQEDLVDFGLLLSGEAPPLTAEQAQRSLAERFGVPPFSVLDARQGYWQERKRAWIALGIQSELGRGGGLTMSAKQVTAEGLNFYRNKKSAQAAACGQQ